jgi:Amt family ammonium transporter
MAAHDKLRRLGFSSGGALGANGRAGMAVLATQMAAAGATLSWSLAEWFLRTRQSVLGAISGAVAGLGLDIALHGEQML